MAEIAMVDKQLQCMIMITLSKEEARAMIVIDILRGVEEADLPFLLQRRHTNQGILIKWDAAPHSSPAAMDQLERVTSPEIPQQKGEIKQFY